MHANCRQEDTCISRHMYMYYMYQSVMHASLKTCTCRPKPTGISYLYKIAVLSLNEQNWEGTADWNENMSQLLNLANIAVSTIQVPMVVTQCPNILPSRLLLPILVPTTVL